MIKWERKVINNEQKFIIIVVIKSSDIHNDFIKNKYELKMKKLAWELTEQMNMYLPCWFTSNCLRVAP